LGGGGGSTHLSPGPSQDWSKTDENMGVTFTRKYLILHRPATESIPIPACQKALIQS